jgi:hypothetical protein
MINVSRTVFDEDGDDRVRHYQRDRFLMRMTA